MNDLRTTTPIVAVVLHLGIRVDSSFVLVRFRSRFRWVFTRSRGPRPHEEGYTRGEDGGLLRGGWPLPALRGGDPSHPPGCLLPVLPVQVRFVNVNAVAVLLLFRIVRGWRRRCWCFAPKPPLLFVSLSLGPQPPTLASGGGDRGSGFRSVMVVVVVLPRTQREPAPPDKPGPSRSRRRPEKESRRRRRHHRSRIDYCNVPRDSNKKPARSVVVVIIVVAVVVVVVARDRKRKTSSEIPALRCRSDPGLYRSIDRSIKRSLANSLTRSRWIGR